MNKKRATQQNEFILDKYKLSDKTYTNTYHRPEDLYVFLNDYDNMNVFSLYPEMIVCPVDLHPNDRDANVHNVSYVIDQTNHSEIGAFQYRITKMGNIYTKIKNKFNEYEGDDKQGFKEYARLKKQYEGAKISYYMHYHVIDAVRANLGQPDISNAWIKSYEILHTFKLVEQCTEDMFESFHICELPGGFVLALKWYIETHTTKTLNWIAQSLNPYNQTNRQTMKGKYLPDQYNLAKNNKANYDWGADNTGDITNVENIRYYHTKYGRTRDLVTSDCGQDASDNFTEQETHLIKVYWGQFACAMGLLRKGGSYFMKMFTVHTIKMIEIVWLATLLFEQVQIVKPLKTTFMSGEVYMVCKGFRDIDTDKYLEHFYRYLEHFDAVNLVNLDIISDEFIEQLNDCNVLMGKRRLVNINTQIFVTNNIGYYSKYPQIKRHIDNIVEYYTKYFCDYYNLTAR